ncbi:hypothetical protein Ddye_031312 [Dipteronia dyeriana]|uniref:C2H2-type domain-containing protein n=1 Tax=Dipteronia dyeriana TaxID=168575 RepID=A0AAD9TJ88_9ROSI|nr:hypothetical protein Ddye_031312 [Dipteronia dyeriana]
MGLVRAVVVFVDHLFVPRRERDEIGVRVSAVVVAAPKQKQWLRRNPVLFVCPKVRSVMLHPKLSRMLINSTQGKRSLVMSSPQHNKLSNICGNGFSSRSVLSLHLESVHKTRRRRASTVIGGSVELKDLIEMLPLMLLFLFNYLSM